MHAGDAPQARMVRLDRPYRFVSPFDGEEFALLLVVGDADISPRRFAVLPASG
jgi:hypothetical protein